MCGRFYQDAQLEEYWYFKDKIAKTTLGPKDNVGLRDDALIVAQGLKVLYANFWLVPTWYKSRDEAYKFATYNARSEEIFERPSFRELIKKNRCVIPVSGYYESTANGKKKQPWFIHFKNKPSFLLAGVWSSWEDPNGGKDLYQSFAIVTTEANALVSKYHHRMPVILHESKVEEWLSPTLSKKDELSDFMKPFSPNNMEVYPVTSKILSGLRGSECIKQIENIQGELF